MSNNVINLLDVWRARAAQAEGLAKATPPVHLNQPFGVDEATINAKAYAGRQLYMAYSNAFALRDDFLIFHKATSLDLVLDLRVAPRLDFVRPLRKQVFDLFEMCGIEYRDMLGRLSVSTYDLPQSRFDELLNAVDSLHRSHAEGCSTLVLFDNLMFARSCAAKLNQSASVMPLDTDAIRRLVSSCARSDGFPQHPLYIGYDKLPLPMP